MKLIADQKRRVVLPKPAEPGDVFEVIESGERLVLSNWSVQTPCARRFLLSRRILDC
jgi:hypothetical protein